MGWTLNALDIVNIWKDTGEKGVIYQKKICMKYLWLSWTYLCQSYILNILPGLWRQKTEVIFTILNELIIWLWGEVYKSKYRRDNWDKGFKKSFSVLRKDNKEYLQNNQINIWTEKSKNEMVWMSIRAQKAEWKRIVIGGKDCSKRGKQTCTKRTMAWDQGQWISVAGIKTCKRLWWRRHAWSEVEMM